MERYPAPDMEEYASVLDRRFEAVFLDSLLVGVAVGLLGYLAGTLLLSGPYAGMGAAYVSLVFVSPFALLGYQIGMEGYFGQTIGKYLRGIVVVKADGSQCTWGASVGRNLLRIVDVLPSFYIIGAVVALATDRHQRVGDLVADTVVVYVGE